MALLLSLSICFLTWAEQCLSKSISTSYIRLLPKFDQLIRHYMMVIWWYLSLWNIDTYLPNMEEYSVFLYSTFMNVYNRVQCGYLTKLSLQEPGGLVQGSGKTGRHNNWHREVKDTRKCASYNLNIYQTHYWAGQGETDL